MTDAFERWTNEDVVKLIREHPLAWIAPQEHDIFPGLMPMLVECDSNGAPISLLGHLPKRHPIAAALKVNGAARFLFLGPNAYISPEFVSNKNWAPTWNYAAVQIDGAAALDDALTEEALAKLVTHMENERAQPWSVSMLGERYQALKSRVIGFRVQISAIRGRFKLGQDESETAFGEIADGLADPDLVQWMRRFRPVSYGD